MFETIFEERTLTRYTCSGTVRVTLSDLYCRSDTRVADCVTGLRNKLDGALVRFPLRSTPDLAYDRLPTATEGTHTRFQQVTAEHLEQFSICNMIRWAVFGYLTPLSLSFKMRFLRAIFKYSRTILDRLFKTVCNRLSPVIFSTHF